jgi:hypothetical protein
MNPKRATGSAKGLTIVNSVAAVDGSFLGTMNVSSGGQRGSSAEDEPKGP